MGANPDSLRAGPSLAQAAFKGPAARTSLRVAVRHASLDVLAALQQEHTCRTAAASCSVPAGSIRASAADIVLMHHSDACRPQPEGHGRTQQRAAKQIDATALAATATLFGPGAPFAHVSLPCTLQGPVLADALASAPILNMPPVDA